ncbi:MAG: L-seryl-tRNA(Sec) selenium transferase, partial [Armatimonadetes bacterium]|nr:L-seryl-tRNA(Sec) selenium transferase [Armatimonadota bacterium]
MAESGESGAAAEGGGARPRAGLRRLPGVDRLLERPATAELVRQFGHPAVVAALREAVNGLRQAVLDGTSLPDEPDSAALAAAEACLVLAARPTLRRAVNATGVVLHTGLGRAVLAEAALQAALEAGRSHALLEVDPESGERGNRQDHIRPLLCGLTGAEDGLAVNNNAAAVFLALSALASDREVVIARGQLVEIGGSFRIPDVIRQSGARLVEVGTTNRVRLSDYAAALTPDTALILRVHPSNFRIVGFTAEPPLEEMVRLGRERGVPVMDDLGSGALVDLSRHGLRDEPTVQQSVQAGADVVTFSGDKLLGGPQAGLIAGRRGLLARMIQHPLMRVVRL